MHKIYDFIQDIINKEYTICYSLVSDYEIVINYEDDNYTVYELTITKTDSTLIIQNTILFLYCEDFDICELIYDNAIEFEYEIDLSDYQDIDFWYELLDSIKEESVKLEDLLTPLINEASNIKNNLTPSQIEKLVKLLQQTYE